MKRKNLALLFVLMALLLVSILGACERDLPEIPFGGVMATYAVTLDETQVIETLQAAQVEQTRIAGVTTEMTATPTTPDQEKEIDIPATLTPSADTTLPADNNLTLSPQSTSTPSATRASSGSREEFLSYWEGTWYIWFELNGMLLEGEIEFERDDSYVKAKTEMNNQIFAFNLVYYTNENLYNIFNKGQWESESSLSPMHMALWPQNENQAIGYHSRPAQTFCASRNKDEKPDPCFLSPDS